MKILIIGAGGREHALAWQLARSGHAVLAAPGNPGISQCAECLAVSVGDIDALVADATGRAVDLVVVGPEAPLVAGIADRLRSAGVPVFGPGADGAQLEGSKSFSKQFFARHGIRSAEFVECGRLQEADQAIDRFAAKYDGRMVVKADGLAAGKGVTVCSTADEARGAVRDCLELGKFGSAGAKVVIEQQLEGRELSLMAITDGSRYELLEQAEDHKAVFDGDRGPNTGGMGTVSPAAWASAELIARARREIFDPTLAGLRADGIEFRGVLYAGLMVAEDGTPWLLEYNVRFGDPETQPLMARLRSDFGQWLLGAANGDLPTESLQWDPRTAVCVIMAAQGYPDSPRKGDAITGLPAGGADDEVIVFQAGTSQAAGQLVTSGGRVLAVTALGDCTEAARARAYGVVQQIEFRGSHYRQDIGVRGGGQ